MFLWVTINQIHVNSKCLHINSLVARYTLVKLKRVHDLWSTRKATVLSGAVSLYYMFSMVCNWGLVVDCSINTIRYAFFIKLLLSLIFGLHYHNSFLISFLIEICNPLILSYCYYVLTLVRSQRSPMGRLTSYSFMLSYWFTCPLSTTSSLSSTLISIRLVLILC